MIPNLTYSCNGHTFTLKPAPARLAMRCGYRVAAVIAPVMSGISRLKTPEGAFGAALVYLFQNPALEDNMVWLCDTLAPYTEVFVDGANPPVSFTLSGTGPQGPWIDVLFAGAQDALMDWLGKALEQNCSSFLGGLLRKRVDLEKALGDLQGKSSASPSPAEKSG